MDRTLCQTTWTIQSAHLSLLITSHMTKCDMIRIDVMLYKNWLLLQGI